MKPYSLSYEQLPELGGIDRRYNAYDLAVTQNYTEPLCKLIEPFWKQLADIVLMPLTSEYYPEQNDMKNFLSDPHMSERQTDVQENLCLRLTQNFQFIDPRGSCNIQLVTENGDTNYKMAFRDIYAHCK